MKKILISISLLILLPLFASAQEATIVDIVFPVDGVVTFQDDFDDARYGHSHGATDLMGEKMMPILAAASGTVTWAPTPEPSYGFMLTVNGDDGYTYNYIHLNNDTPGTDDGLGGAVNAYAPGVRQGARITRGQHIAWMGDSGNAEGMQAHLHFEILTADGTPINPYYSLINLLAATNYNPETEKLITPTISANRDLSTTSASNSSCQADTLIKSPTSTSVYYCGVDGRRYAFPSDRVFFSWYSDFDDVQVITAEELASALLAGNVRYRPGVKLIKIQTDLKVYAIGKGGILRWVASEEIAVQLYGSDWGSQVDDVSETLFINYTVGDPITFVSN